MTSLPHPLAGPPPAEVPLDHAPLAIVIAQLKFPLVARIADPGQVVAFQEAIRADYPVLHREPIVRRVRMGSGLREEEASAWIFRSAEGAWRVVLAEDFLALEARRYTSRRDFLARLDLLFTALAALLGTSYVDRLGIRYIDRIVGADLADIPKLVRPEVAGLLTTPWQSAVRQSLGLNLVQIEEEPAQTMIRSGLVAAGATSDPNAIEPLDEASWILDIDTFRSFEAGRFLLEPAPLLALARNYCERIYSVFRWSVTDEFLQRCGRK